MASEHRGRLQPGAGSLAPRLDALAASLSRTYELLARQPPADGRSIAVEWLLDNDYVIQGAVEQVRAALPAEYYRQLPRLTSGPEAGTPRVLALARAVLRTGARGADPVAAAEPWLRAYQEVLHLSIGELWAFPALLRLAVLEELAAAAEAIRREPGGAEAGEPEVGRAIGVLRAIASRDWRDFFERTSRVEAVLRGDPAGAYEGMTFETRDLYRRAVETIARRSAGVEEEAVAREAVRLARERAARAGGAERVSHVGTYLLAEGRASLEAAVGCRVPRRSRLGRRLAVHATGLYLGAVALVWALAMTAPGLLLGAWGAGGAGLAVGLALAAPAGLGLAIAVVDWLATLLVPPRVLPRMDFSDGIPAGARTVVVMPVIVGRAAEVKTLLSRLEIHYLGNPDPRLSFALLTDFADAPRREMPADRLILRAARNGIRRLNRRYGASGHKPFHLFHRERRWNPAEERWMGWERKRGKLEEFNRLLAGEGETSFTVVVDPPDDLARFRYVVTLDADTRLPPGSAAGLIGAFAHPLNRPVLDARTGRLTAGYTVLQPRLATVASAANATRFSRIFVGEAGLDLYTRAVSDVYHDLFGQAVFTGKGIYDVRAFTRTLEGRVPENRLLSHDLFEGVHGRVGLVSDVVLYEDYPPNVLLNAHRLHRWVRGDWQLLPWLFRRVPARGGRRIASELSLLDRWKIVDNLRRSLFLPSVAALFAAAWFGLDGVPAAIATVGIAALLGAPMVLGTLAEIRRGVIGRAWRPALDSALHGVRIEAARWALTLIFLAYQSAVVADAVARTVYRVAVSRRRLLEWTTAARAAREAGAGLAPGVAWRRMRAAPALAAALAAALGALAPHALPAAAPVLLAWLLSPQAAWWSSRPASRPRETLDDRERRLLRSIARRTWHFFEEVVGPGDHWLPPDHLQEEPATGPARRTSPTNVAMLLLSTLAAYDLGYLGLRALAERIAATLDTLERLPRHDRGHWFNWYDTRDLRVLEPRYVSTVDSGNLAAAFLVLGHGLRRVSTRRFPTPRRLAGLADTIGVLRRTVRDVVGRTDREARALAAAFGALEDELRRAVDDTAERRREQLERLAPRVAELTARIPDLLERHRERLEAPRLADLRAWSAHALVEAGSARDEAARLLPWQLPLARPPALYRAAPPGSARAKALARLRRDLGDAPRLQRLPLVADACRRLIADLDEGLGPADGAAEVEEARRWHRELDGALEQSAARARELIADLERSSARLLRWFDEMDFGFLYDRSRHLFHIGYDLTAGRLDPNHYDLLASEARIASFLAIAKGDAPLEHWLRLGRPVIRLAGSRVLLSWGATMFEYLMPPLVLRVLARTLLEESCWVAVSRQMAFAGRHGIPWGMSESGFAELGVHGDYQYRAFGVPGLGLKRDLGDRLVIAPYASLLALRFRPGAAMANVERLIAAGALGHYGLVEALDFGLAEGPRTRAPRVVHSFMAHHQGMILVAAVNHLQGDPMVKRLHADPRVASVELLLHEQIPKSARARVRWRRSESAAAERLKAGEEVPQTGSWTVPVRGAFRRTAALSNGSYTVLIDSAGAGVSRWGETALTRWRPDPSVAAWGTWIYLRDRASGDLWSAGLEPIAGAGDDCEAEFAPHAVELRRRHGTIRARTTVAVAADLAEIRRVALTNEGDRPRSLFLTSYAEVVLGSQAGDRRHPAFSGLFVESEFRPAERALVFRRRRRAPEEREAVLGHALLLGRGPQPELRWETDRGRFLGRGRNRRSPRALDDPERGMTGTTGATLDPVMALGCAVDLAPGETVEAVFVTAAGPTDAAVLGAIGRLSSLHAVDWAVEKSRIRGEAELRELGVEPGEAREHAEILSLLLAPREGLRGDLGAAAGAIEPVLWSHGISGDLPVLLVRVRDPDRMEPVDAALRAHAWWRSRRVGIDLVLLDEVSRGYDQPAHDRLARSVARIGRTAAGRGPGRVFVLRADQLGGHLPELLAAARVVFDTAAGPLAGQLARGEAAAAELPRFVPVPGALPPPHEAPPLARPAGLAFDNGVGGFAPADAGDAGDDYVVFLPPCRRPPAPWINVVANPRFGFLVSEAGAGCTWAGNSGENRLTPWHNDPVTDPAGEAVYLRDEETAVVWSPTPGPAPANAPYEVRHSAGRTLFRHRSHGLEQELELFVDPEAPVKLAVLRVRDLSRRPRRLTATYYAEWVLGAVRERTGPFVVPDYDAETGALLASNRLGTPAGRGVAFLAAGRPPHGLTTDRAEFLGPEGDPARPRALERIGLSGSVRPGVDPCAALQVHFDLAPGEAVTTHFVLGRGEDREEALALARRFRDPEAVDGAARASAERWRGLLGRIRVATPDAGIDRMLNRWLPYQAVACRLWGRTALYQSSGAYGFRDQLQDAANLAALAPALARDHLLSAAARQFEEGDVLHWWHPDTGAGVRTRCSDDLLWLPWACARYLAVTGDRSVLDEEIPFLAAPPLAGDEVERFGRYEPGERAASLYEHCLRAIVRGGTRGPHGLPLIGSGDWNDGMNRLGLAGRGESVWLGWFLCAVLRGFAPVCAAAGEPERGEALLDQARGYVSAIEEHGWDGAWYRRAYDDQGRPVGSAAGEECQLDLIAQAWAVLSGAGDPERCAVAMASVRERLLRREDGLLLLLEPPFDRGDLDPGYIQAYPPGVRENGGQYTHGAVWGAWAFAELGEGDLAVELLRMLLPVERAATAGGAERYRVEPYVVAADVYGGSGHDGRGGWTWYTGAAGWLYRYGVEAVLGLRRRGADLEVSPCIARDWPGFEAEIREGAAVYDIRVENPDRVCRGVREVELDGRRLDGDRIPLRDDGGRHRVVVRMGPSEPPAEAGDG